ncbi:unnamed protein product [Euphydryas editha]|uniref:BEN domain-containing protein n=1 Tax=Euphydryas editha TaxID=104508 RepID=A0AAU9U0R1_EUPED|nr:unnamed protein product [Euphydryas editha]
MYKDLWLLLEWVETGDSFSDYVVRSTCNLLIYETNLHVGKVVYVCDTVNGIARQAKIVKVSEKKDYIDMLKIMLNKNRKEGKTFISSRISGPVKADQDSGSVDSVGPATDSSTPAPSGSSEDIDTDQESEPTTNKLLRRPVVSSTPIPDTNTSTLVVDVGTQTDPSVSDRLKEKSEEMTNLSKKLREAYISFKERLPLKVDESRVLLDDTFNESTSDECVEVSRIQDKSANPQITSSHKYNLRKKTMPLKKMEVSAQTTNNSLPSTSKDDEMVASGSDYVTMFEREFAAIKLKSTALITLSKQILQSISQEGHNKINEENEQRKVVKKVLKQIDRENVPPLTESSNESDDTPD